MPLGCHLLKMEEKKLVENHPSNYGNINFDDELEEQPSAPADDEDCEEFEGATEILVAPSAPPYVPKPGPKTLTYFVPSLVFEEIYEACIQYVNEHWCYGSRFVRQMRVAEIINDSAFYYTLESFCEKRESAPACTPYNGQFIDGPENGPPPAPWDIEVQPSALFHGGKAKVEIPHTAYVKMCDKCQGNGRVRCSSCFGRGRRTCISCGGSGRRSSDRRRCISCSGSGRRRCWRCHGSGRVKCKKCDGHGNLKCYRMLIVTWTNNIDEFSTRTQNIPPKLFKKVRGSSMLHEDDIMLMPIENAPDECVNSASFRLIETHRTSFPSERILRQRQILQAIPLTKVLYEWKGKEGEFNVYGHEKKVFFEEYPQKCCCCTCL